MLALEGGIRRLLAALAAGRLPGEPAVTALGGIAPLPLLTCRTRQPAVVTDACLAMLLPTVQKRLEANPAPLPADAGERRRVWWKRLLLDRDTASWDAWMLRRPIPQRDGPPL
jgi:hypothetical protein